MSCRTFSEQQRTRSLDVEFLEELRDLTGGSKSRLQRAGSLQVAGDAHTPGPARRTSSASSCQPGPLRTRVPTPSVPWALGGEGLRYTHDRPPLGPCANPSQPASCGDEHGALYAMLLDEIECLLEDRRQLLLHHSKLAQENVELAEMVGRLSCMLEDPRWTPVPAQYISNCCPPFGSQRQQQQQQQQLLHHHQKQPQRLQRQCSAPHAFLTRQRSQEMQAASAEHILLSLQRQAPHEGSLLLRQASLGPPTLGSMQQRRLFQSTRLQPVSSSSSSDSSSDNDGGGGSVSESATLSPQDL